MAKKGKSRLVQQTDYPQVDLSEVIRILGVISRTLGVLAIRHSHTRSKTEGERVFFLDSLGFDRNEIAATLSGDPNTISVHLSQQKKKKSTRRGKN